GPSHRGLAPSAGLRPSARDDTTTSDKSPSQTQHPLRDDVLLDLVRAAADRTAPHLEVLGRHPELITGADLLRIALAPHRTSFEPPAIHVPVIWKYSGAIRN